MGELEPKPAAPAVAAVRVALVAAVCPGALALPPLAAATAAYHSLIRALPILACTFCTSAPSQLERGPFPAVSVPAISAAARRLGVGDRLRCAGGEAGGGGEPGRTSSAEQSAPGRGGRVCWSRAPIARPALRNPSLPRRMRPAYLLAALAALQVADGRFFIAMIPNGARVPADIRVLACSEPIAVDSRPPVPEGWVHHARLSGAGVQVVDAPPLTCAPKSAATACTSWADVKMCRRSSLPQMWW